MYEIQLRLLPRTIITLRVRLKNVPRQKLQSNILYHEILYEYSQGLSTLPLRILLIYIEMARSEIQSTIFLSRQPAMHISLQRTKTKTNFFQRKRHFAKKSVII